jgi:hypothetical protein
MLAVRGSGHEFRTWGQATPARDPAMSLPIPDKGKVLYCQSNVTTPTVDKVPAAYDLTLYPEVGKSDRAVLEVYTTVQFQFVSGKTKAGTALNWTPAEKKVYAQKFCDSVFGVWDNRHRITDTSGNAQWKDVGVVFELDYWIDGWTASEHWEFEVKKVDEFNVSYVMVQQNTGVMDNQDTDSTLKFVSPDRKSDLYQRPAAHEFGHCLGFNDEYATDDNHHNMYWTWDRDSILHSGEQVRERHYATFAHWLTQQMEAGGTNRQLRKLGYKPITYKVNGTTDLTTAKV